MELLDVPPKKVPVFFKRNDLEAAQRNIAALEKTGSGAIFDRVVMIWRADRPHNTFLWRTNWPIHALDGKCSCNVFRFGCRHLKFLLGVFAVILDCFGAEFDLEFLTSIILPSQLKIARWHQKNAGAFVGWQSEV